jgi:hypothetical protein
MKAITFSNQHFYIGIDTHLKRWRVTIRNCGLELKTFSMNPSADELYKYLIKHYPDGTFFIVYEAGFCGLNRLIFPISKKLSLVINLNLTIGGIKCITQASIFINLLLTSPLSILPVQ